MIDSNRLKHSLEVARFLKEIGEKKGIGKEKANALFLMGFIHDIGYELDESDHEEAGMEIVHDAIPYIQNIAYAIKEHGNPDKSSEFLDILQFADMSVNEKGKRVTFKDRLKGIEKRRGKDSEAFQKSVKVIKKLST